VVRILLGGTPTGPGRPTGIDAAGLTSAFAPFRLERFAPTAGQQEDPGPWRGSSVGG